MDLEKNRILSDRPEPAPGVLYVVGTPIGNLGDFSLFRWWFVTRTRPFPTPPTFPQEIFGYFLYSF